MRARAGLVATTVVAAAALVTAASVPVGAVNADHGNRVVSANPANVTPHVMNGSVNAITQIGNKVIAAGTFTSVSPAATYTNTADDLVRNGIFAFDATTGAIDTAFNPNLAGSANSLDTDGTYVYVGGSFSSVGGNGAIRRVVKLDGRRCCGDSLPGRPERQGQRDRGPRATRVHRRELHQRRHVRRHRKPQRSGCARQHHRCGARRSQRAVHRRLQPGQQRWSERCIKRFDVSADGSRLAAVGNFATVGGQPRVQIAMLDTSGATATVAPWTTNRFDRAHNSCAGAFDTFMRDVDFAPNGTYLAVSTTGAFAGGANAGTLCDTITRWETASTGNDPTWADYTGGDTSDRVAVHRIRRVRRWPHAVVQQPVPGRPGRPGRCAALGHRGPRPGQRHATQVESRPRPRRRGAGPVRHQPGVPGRR